MKIVDTPNEQDILESLLESSKPALPDDLARLHYLLATPFRYWPGRGGSRFRGEFDPGVFYGAETIRTACAELGYWRWKFLQDADGLDHLDPVSHTGFKALFDTRVVDLRQPPFSADAAAWMHPADYRATQRFAAIAREAGIGGIVYQSVRDPEPGWNVALLTPRAFAKPSPDRFMQTWWLAVSKDGVVWRRDAERFTFSAEPWKAA
ncbi:RES family NAD+ phosphorylase [Noviherbaspirillum humi]|nr:RES family NAD+ phosphorylase [Noviherbaspirillum humi]